MKKILCMSILGVIFTFITKGVDPQFTQFYAAPIYLGPSYAGISGLSRIALNYRDQWPNLPGHFTTFALSYDTYIAKYKSGLAGMILRDQAGNGKLNTTDLNFSYSYQVKIAKKYYFVPGLAIYYYMSNVDPGKLTYADQYLGEQVLPTTVESPAENYHHIDFATSALFYNENIWFGTTLDHLMKIGPSLNEDYHYAPLKVSIYGGGKIPVTHKFNHRDETTLTLAFNYKIQDYLKQGDIGFYFFKAPLFAGFWYRGLPFISKNAQDALCFLFGYKNETYSIAYNYDFTISPLIANTGGAHEISFIYNLGTISTNRRNLIHRGAIPCPTF